MVRFRGTIFVSHDADKVWSLLSDWGRLSDWDENCASITPKRSGSGRPFSLGIGAQWDCKFDFSGRKVDAVYRCVEWERDIYRAVFEATSTYIRTRDTLEIIQAPGGCQVSFQFELYYRNILAPFSFTLDGKMQRACPRIIGDLKQFVDGQLDEPEEDGCDGEINNNGNSNIEKHVNNVSNVTNISSNASSL